MKTKQQALSLAAVLAATALTGGAAILGLLHRPSPAAGVPTAPATLVQQVPAAHSWSEGGD